MIDVLQYVAFFSWFVFSIFVVLGTVAQLYRPKRSRHKAKNVECVIVSIASHKVERALFKCIVHTKEKLDMPLWLLVDEGSELISELKELKESQLVVVPKSYRRDLIGKGRAINYFVETEVKPENWYSFIDDDNLVLDDGFLYEIPYYEKRGYVAMNPVLIPRRGKSGLTYIMDFIRRFDDLMIFRFFSGLLKRPLLGLHGELLTVKGGVLKEIGYDNPSLVEDFRFSIGLVWRGYRTWQSATEVSILSPNSLGDLVKQRGRWFRGIVEDWRYCSFLMKGIVGLRLLMWCLGLLGSWLLFPLWFFWSTFYFAIPGGLFYWMVYSYGVVKLGKPYYFFLIPLLGILEAGSIYAGLKQKGYFLVIDKN